MTPNQIQFLCGLVAGGCIISAAWLRWDLVERLLVQMSEDLKTMDGIIGVVMAICLGIAVGNAAVFVIIAAIETLAAVLRK